jgi:hypothetical protein
MSEKARAASFFRLDVAKGHEVEAMILIEQREQALHRQSTSARS